MTVVVNDANILIDLVKLQILPHFFSIDFNFCTTDLVLYELYEQQQEALLPYIDKGKLIVHKISEKQLIEIFEIKQQNPSLSEQDCSAFYQAQQLDATLITSDNTLRKFAKENDLDVHGHLWIFDRMVEAKTITPQRATKKLDELCNKVNPKLNLPPEECTKRKELWQNQFLN